MRKLDQRLGQQPMSKWRKLLTGIPYKTIATEYQGQMFPLLLEEFDIFVVDTPYKKKLRQEIKTSGRKRNFRKSTIESGAEIGSAWYIMSQFTNTDPYYNYWALSKKGVMQVFVERKTGFDGIIEAFAKDPQNFSIAGFEQQYASQELNYLQDISKCYQRYGTHVKTDNSIVITMINTGSAIEGIYAHIFGNRYEPSFSNMWHNVITAAASYINLYSASMMSSRHQESDVSASLHTFIVTLDTLAKATQQNRNEYDKRWFQINWLFKNKDSTPDRQECTEFAGFCLFCDSLQSNSAVDDDKMAEQSFTIELGKKYRNLSLNESRIVMHKAGKKRIGRYRRDHWYDRISYSDRAISLEYEGQTIPVYLPAYDTWVVDTEFSRQQRQIKRADNKPKSARWKYRFGESATTGQLSWVMDEFTGHDASGLTYYYHTLSKEKLVLWHCHGFDEILSAFAKDPQHFSITGFEYQYALQELALLHAIAKRYQQFGLRKQIRTSATNLPPLGSHVSLSIVQAQAIYTRIAPLEHRNSPEFSALWATVINAATTYAVSHNEAMLVSKNQTSATAASLDTFKDALQELATAFPQKDNNSEWLSLLGESRIKYQNFASYLLLFETLQDNQ
ncbi:hypothetical protein [Lactiplantibacillus pingfangensis]|uniref:hypothetical protein n=1 Tax=Lactiplantibacillus pingfangensis TaxID=2559915 RepID=UPI001485918D|nr:hypothetical protein [Lactiplantibacillus pingfangensis]